MASKVLTDAYLKIGDVDYSSKSVDVALSFSANTVDVSTMGTDAWGAQEAGQKSWSLSASFIADDASVDALFDSLGDIVSVEVRATTDAISATNPAYVSDKGSITAFSPLDGSFGEARKYTVEISGAGAMTKITTDPDA